MQSQPRTRWTQVLGETDPDRADWRIASQLHVTQLSIERVGLSGQTRPFADDGIFQTNEIDVVLLEYQSSVGIFAGKVLGDEQRRRANAGDAYSERLEG